MDVLIASSARDAQAVEMIVAHHAAMAGALIAKVEDLVTAATRGDTAAATSARQRLITWCEAELVPHAVAEEEAMYPAARATVEGNLLVTAMIEEHVTIVDLVREISASAEPVRAAAAARALLAVFDVHVAKENELVLPLLAAAPGLSVADVLENMHKNLDTASAQPSAVTNSSTPAVSTAPAQASPGGCACGGHDDAGLPELDVQTIPHAIRHATIFGALDALDAGGGLIIAANHNPVPLLAQLEQRAPGAYEIDYVEEGPETWKVRFVRN